jgi:hypothetical protein
VPFPGTVTLELFNLRGERVWKWDLPCAAKGSYLPTWDARNLSGKSVSFGEYYLVVAEEGTEGYQRKRGRWISVVR